MPIATIQSQLQQLQNQLKLSKSPKQTKMLKSAIARFEEKLKEEAEQARLKAEAEAKAAQEAREKAEQEAQTQKEREAIANRASTQVESKTKRDPLPPKNKQRVKKGKILEAVPGQGQHVFCWKIWATIQNDELGNYLMHLEDIGAPLLISRLSKKARITLENLELPVQRFCTLYPTIKDGTIESVKLQYCSNREKESELFFVKGYWIAETETLQIQTDFQFHRARSQNIFHKIPVKKGVTPPQTGFRALQLERDRLNVSVVGDLPMEKEG